MKVETYSDEYFQDVVKLVEAFHGSYLSDIYNKSDRSSVTETIKGFDAKNLFLLVIDETCQGLLGGVELKLRSNNQLIFQEIIWYVSKPYGKYAFYLLEEAKKLLKERGFSFIIMAVLEGPKSDRIVRIYERIGFKKLETHYMRSL